MLWSPKFPPKNPKTRHRQQDFVDIKLDARNLIEADVKSALTDLDWFGKERDTGPGKANGGPLNPLELLMNDEM